MTSTYSWLSWPWANWNKKQHPVRRQCWGVLNINLDWYRILIYRFYGRSLKVYFRTPLCWVLVRCVFSLSYPFLSQCSDWFLGFCNSGFFAFRSFLCESLAHMRKGMWYLFFCNYLVFISTLTVSNVHFPFVILFFFVTDYYILYMPFSIHSSVEGTSTGFIAQLLWIVF